MSEARVRTTVAIPENLLKSVDAAVREGMAGSRNEFLTLALENQLAALRRRAMDAAFAETANDPIYRRETEQIAEEFRFADWEAFQIAERAS